MEGAATSESPLVVMIAWYAFAARELPRASPSSNAGLVALTVKLVAAGTSDENSQTSAAFREKGSA